MTEYDTVYALAGSYADRQAAEADFDAVSVAHKNGLIGRFQAAIFTKEPDGKVKIVNTTSTTRSSGARWGAAVGAIAGALFPPSILVGAVAGGALGAMSGNLVKGWGAAELKRFGEALDAGEVGVIVIAESLASEGEPALLPGAEARDVQHQPLMRDLLLETEDEGKE